MCDWTGFFFLGLYDMIGLWQFRLACVWLDSGPYRLLGSYCGVLLFLEILIETWAAVNGMSETGFMFCCPRVSCRCHLQWILPPHYSIPAFFPDAQPIMSQSVSVVLLQHITCKCPSSRHLHLQSRHFFRLDSICPSDFFFFLKPIVYVMLLLSLSLPLSFTCSPLSVRL